MGPWVNGNGGTNVELGVQVPKFSLITNQLKPAQRACFLVFEGFPPSFSLLVACSKAQSALGMAREMAEVGQGESQRQGQSNARVWCTKQT